MKGKGSKTLEDPTGGNDGEVPPVPIPNTVVKLSSAESTWLDTAREDRSLPVPYLRKSIDFLFSCFWQIKAGEHCSPLRDQVRLSGLRALMNQLYCVHDDTLGQQVLRCKELPGQGGDVSMAAVLAQEERGI